MQHLKKQSKHQNKHFWYEWPTLLVTLICYCCFLSVTTYAHTLGTVLSIIALSLVLTLYSSLQHEVLHGHPFQNEILNTALVFPAFGLFIPYERFKTTHLQHHFDPSLTDPYEDPESNFIDPQVWNHWPAWKKGIFMFNNTLFGRMSFGPAISLWTFYRDDFKSCINGEGEIIKAYGLHFAGLMLVALWFSYVAEMSFLALLFSAYLSFSILKIRTFLEHRAHLHARCRTVIIEDRGPLSFLFLNNNFHAAHHCKPQMSWFELPTHYFTRRGEYLARNEGYAFASYFEVFAKFLFKAKDDVPHPLWNDETGNMVGSPHQTCDENILQHPAE